MTPLARIAPENRPIVLAAAFVVVIVLAGSGYKLSTQGRAPLLKQSYLLE